MKQIRHWISKIIILWNNIVDITSFFQCTFVETAETFSNGLGLDHFHFYQHSTFRSCSYAILFTLWSVISKRFYRSKYLKTKLYDRFSNNEWFGQTIFLLIVNIYYQWNSRLLKTDHNPGFFFLKESGTSMERVIRNLK